MLVAPALALLVEAHALAAPGATIQIEPELPVAPALITLTASTTPEEVVIAYRWSGLDGHPPCREARCSFEIAAASCRQVRLEATTQVGDVLSSEATVCATDAGALPPRVRWSATAGKLEPLAQAGDGEIMLRRLWLDEEERPFGALTVPEDGDCHALDALVVDEAGRMGMAGEVVCTGPEAPRITLSAAEPCPPPGETFELCAEASDPRGRDLIRRSGEAPLGACGASVVLAGEVVRHVLRVENEEGVSAWASLLGCARVDQAPFTMMFASVPPSMSGDEGAALDVPFTLHGGVAPFFARGALGRQRVEGLIDQSGRLRLPFLPLVVSGNAEEHVLELLVEDGRGLRAAVEARVRVRDLGPAVIDPNPVSFGAGCRCAPVGEGPSGLLVLLAGLLVLGRRR